MMGRDCQEREKGLRIGDAKDKPSTRQFLSIDLTLTSRILGRLVRVRFMVCKTSQ